MGISWVIEGHNLFHVFVKSLSHLGNYIWLINLEVHLGEVTLDPTPREVL